MADRVVEPDAPPAGTPPAGTPEPEPKGTPPAGTGEGAPPAAAPPADGDAPGAAEEAAAWENIRAKYPNLSEDALREKVAEQLWSKTNYAKEQRERAERAERERDELRQAQKPPPKDEPPAPHPDVEKITTKIKGLVEKDKGLFAEAEGAAKTFNEKNTEAAELRGAAKHAKDSGDEDGARHLSAEARAVQAEASAAQTNWKMIAARREDLSTQVEELIAEQRFIDEYHRNSTAQETQDREEDERVINSVPAWIDQRAHEMANEMKLPEDKHTRDRLHKHVRRAVHYTLGSPEHRDKSIFDVPLGDIIKGHIKEFVEDNDIKARQDFAKESREKLDVATPKGGSGTPPKAPDTGTPKPPTRPEGKVPVSYLARGGSELPEAWKRGRAYLKERGID